MKSPFHRLKSKLRSDKQPGRDPINVPAISPPTHLPVAGQSTPEAWKPLRPSHETAVVPEPSHPQPRIPDPDTDTRIAALTPLKETPQSNQSSAAATITTIYPPQNPNQFTVETIVRRGSNNAPNIPGPGDASGSLRSALGGIIDVLKTYDQFTDSKEDVAGLIDRLTSLERTTLSRINDTEESKRRDKLQSAFQRTLADVNEIRSNQNQALEPVSSHRKEQVLTGYMKDIHDALLDYQVSLRHDKPQMVHDTSMVTPPSAGSSQSVIQDPQSTSSGIKSARPGFFTGATNIDASHGIFTDVGGDLNIIKIEMQGNDLLLLDKLPHAKSAGHLSVNHGTCLTGTRRGELQRIEDWEADFTEKCVYWLNGIAGCGKSTMARTFAELSVGRGRLGAAFFCSRDFDDRRNIRLIFPTLAYNLAYRYPEFKAALIPILSSNPDIGHTLPAVQLENLLVQPLKFTGLSTTIIIDALDECEDDQPASAILSVLARRIEVIPSVKFFITGRPEPPIRSGFRLPLLRPHTEVLLLHDIDRESVDQDIELYVRTRLSEFVAGRSDYDVTVLWPTNKEVAAIVKKSSGLFIVAYVIVKFVTDRNHDPQERLNMIIGSGESTVYEGSSGVDATYRQIFLQSFKDTDIVAIDRSRLVVGFIVLAFNPLSCASLANILNIPGGEVRRAIRSLHSVLIVPDSDSSLVHVCHKSFADFVIDATRCTDRRFYIDSAILHLKLGTCCLELMNALLKKNMCGLPPYAMNADIGDLDARREKYIGVDLEYVCRSWAKHLRFAPKDGDGVAYAVELLEAFFNTHMLSWLEVLSIISDLRCAVYSLHDVRTWLEDAGLRDTNLLAMVKDSELFVLRFFDPIEASAAHLYHSALPLSPTSSLVRAQYQAEIPQEVKLFNATNASWDVFIRAIQATGSVHIIAFSHKNDLIAVGEQKRVDVFEAVTGQRRATLTDKSSSFSLAFSPGDKLLANGSGSGMVDIWDLQTGGLVSTLKAQKDVFPSVTFSPCGTMIASCSGDHTIRIWNIFSQDCRYVLKGHSDRVLTVCWASKGSQIISGSSDKTVKVWDVVGKRCLKTFSGHADGILSVACSPDSSFIASRSRDGTVTVFNAQTGDIFRTMSTDGNFVYPIRISRRNQIMYTADEKFVTWDFTTNPSELTVASKNRSSRWFRKARSRPESPQGRSSSETSSLVNNANTSIFRYKGLHSALTSDGTRIASFDRGMVRIWQTDSTNQNYDVSSYDFYVNSVAFSADGQLVVSGSDDAIIKVWDVSTGLCVKTFRHSGRVDSVIFSPDSTLCASLAFNHTIRVWDVQTQKLISTVDNQHPTSSIRFSPNGSQLVSLGRQDSNHGSLVSNVILWKVATGERLAEVEVVDGSFEAVAFDVDGSSVILRSNDLATKSWKISPASTSISEPTPGGRGGRKSGSSSQQFTFVPIHDEQQSIFPDSPPCQYHYEPLHEWILDEQGRRVFWVSPDQRGTAKDCFAKKVVLGSRMGRVIIADFSGIYY